MARRPKGEEEGHLTGHLAGRALSGRSREHSDLEKLGWGLLGRAAEGVMDSPSLFVDRQHPSTCPLPRAHPKTSLSWRVDRPGVRCRRPGRTEYPRPGVTSLGRLASFKGTNSKRCAWPSKAQLRHWMKGIPAGGEMRFSGEN